MIVDLRGTHGSGKSYIVHQLIKVCSEKQTVLHESEPIATYLPQFRLAILGFYDRVCGGCDGIKTADDICRRVRLCADVAPNVLLEGILVAHTFARYNNLAAEMEEKGYEYRFGFLDTPFEQCKANVSARRVERGRPPEFDLGHITQDFRLINGSVKTKLLAAGRGCYDVPYETGAATLAGWFLGRVLLRCSCGFFPWNIVLNDPARNTDVPWTREDELDWCEILNYDTAHCPKCGKEI